MVVDKLLIGLNEGIYYAVGYAGNMAVLIKRKFPRMASEMLQTAPGIVQQCAIRKAHLRYIRGIKR
jgi:hypothetical protein